MQQFTIRRTFEPTKSYRSSRLIDVDPGLVAALRAHKAEQNQTRLMVGAAWQDNGLIVCDGLGMPLTHSIIEKLFKRAVRRLGLSERLRPHDLRHSHASVLLAQGTDLRTVADRLGHASPAFTLARYGHSLPGRQRAAALRFADALAPGAVAVEAGG